MIQVARRTGLPVRRAAAARVRAQRRHGGRCRRAPTARGLRGDARGVRGRRHRAVQRRRRHLARRSRPRPPSAAPRSSTTRAPGGWTRPSRSWSARSTPTTSAARGHHRQPELLDDAARARADGPARRGRPRAGRRRHVPGRVSGTGGKAIRELAGPGRGPRRPASPKATRLPAPDRVQRPARRSMSSSTTATRRRSGSSSPRAARSSTCRTCASRAPPSASRSSWPTREAVHVETRDPITPDRARDPLRGGPRGRRPGRPVDLDLPARDRRRRLRRDLRRARPPGPVASTAVAVSRSGS